MRNLRTILARAGATVVLGALVGTGPVAAAGSLAGDRVPTLIYAMQNDTLAPASRLTALYNTAPAATERAYLEVAGAGHNYIGQPSTTLARTMIPWLKLFIDNDTRYSQFLCPTTDLTGISQYRNSCPLVSTAPTSPTARGLFQDRCFRPDTPGRRSGGMGTVSDDIGPCESTQE